MSGNIRALSEVLSGRIDLAEFENGAEIGAVKTANIAVYRKVDKIVRSFKPYGRESRIEISFGGESNSEVRGPAIFDTMIYAVLDNMIKYALGGTEVDVNVVEDGKHFLISFTGISPMILDDEKHKLFQRGFRGEAVSHSGIGGSGMGLFISKRICEQCFSGTITLHEQGSRVSLNNKYCSSKVFLIKIPLVNSFS